MATRKPQARRGNADDIDVGDELQQLLKEQEDFMRQNRKPAVKVTRVGKPPTPPVEETKKLEEAVGHQDEEGETVEQGPQIVGNVRERDVVALTERNRTVQPHAAIGGFPAVSRRGVSLFGRRQKKEPVSTADPSTMLSGMGKIVERAPVVVDTAARMSTQASSSRSDVVSQREWEEIDQSNTAALQSMSAAAIRDAQKELYEMLDPELIAKLKNKKRPASKKTTNPPAATGPRVDGNSGRLTGNNTIVSKVDRVDPLVSTAVSEGIDLSKIETEEQLIQQSQLLPSEERAKHEWMQSVDQSKRATNPSSTNKKRHPLRQQASKKASASTASSERFDFNGDHIVHTTATDVPVHTGLYHHGDEPDAAGYTVDELLHLARSTVASQRTVALLTISKILNKRQRQRVHSERIPRVLPAELPITLRMALDDQNYTALSAAISAMHSYLCPAAVVDGSTSPVDPSSSFESSRGMIVHPPQIHIHADVDESTAVATASHEVIYIDTSASEEDGSVIGDQELTSLDPVQGFLKMDLIGRISYIVDAIQLPDVDAVHKLLDILIHMACHSPHAAQKIVHDKKLVQALQKKYIENDRVLTLDQEPLDLFTQAVALTYKTLVLVRVLCQASRGTAALLITSGAIQSTKGFLALRGGGGASWMVMEKVQRESLRIWRVLLGYGLDFHCLSYLYPLLCGFDGVNLVAHNKAAGVHTVDDNAPATAAAAAVVRWSDKCLSALFTALEAFAMLSTIHEAQHYFSQYFGYFLQLAKDQVAQRLTSATPAEEDLVAVVSALRFLTACCPLVAKFHLDKTPLWTVFQLISSSSSSSSSSSPLWTMGESGCYLVLATTTFAIQMIENDLLQDDQDDENERQQLLQRVKPLLQRAISSTEAKDATSEAVALRCELLVLSASLVIATDHHDHVWVRELYATALQTVPQLPPGYQFWLHGLFSQILFHSVLLQKTGFFPDPNDAKTMSYVLLPIYQALVNSTPAQETHSRLLFAGTSAPSQQGKQTCHLVEPQHEHEYLASNLPLPFFWMFCPFSRLEYASDKSQEDKNGAVRSASTVGPSHAQADEMKVIVSAACRYIDQLETSGILIDSSKSSQQLGGVSKSLGDEDKLFHLMHVFFAGADVLFDDYVDLALTKLLGKYAKNVVQNPNQTVFFDGLLRNLRQFERIEAGESASTATATGSDNAFITETETETVMTFVEKLVNEFTSSSFGNTHFARLVTLFMLHDLPLQVRKWVWKELHASHLLHRLEPFDGGGAEFRMQTGSRATRLAKKSDEALAKLMKQGIATAGSGSGRPVAALSCERGLFAYWIAVHHLVAYLFGDDKHEEELSFARQKLIQELVGDATPVVWRHLLSYDASGGFAPLPHGTIKQERMERVLQFGGLTDAQAMAFRPVTLQLQETE